MSRDRKDPLRPLTADERQELTRLSRSLSAPAAQVERARALLAIADGATYTAAAHQVGRRHNETISAWVSRFNREGLAAVQPGHGGGARGRYGAEAQQRILAEWSRMPQREQDGTATWSLSLLQRALRQADDGLPQVSTYTIWRTLHEAGLSWQKSRTWCETGIAMRKRKHGVVRVSDPDAAVKRGGPSEPTRSAPNLGCRSGARTRRGRFKPCRIPAYPGSRANTRPPSRMNTSAAARPRSCPCFIPPQARCGCNRRPAEPMRFCTRGCASA